MATTLTATQTTVLAPGGDVDLDLVIDPGDTVVTTVTIVNTTAENALNVELNETLDGMDFVPGSLNISALAYDDGYNAVGNVELSVGAADGVLSGATAIHDTFAADAEFLGETVGTNALTDTVIQNPGVAFRTFAGGTVTIAADAASPMRRRSGSPGRIRSTTRSSTRAACKAPGRCRSMSDRRCDSSTIPRRAAPISAPRTTPSPPLRRSMPRRALPMGPARATSSTCAKAPIRSPTASTF